MYDVLVVGGSGVDTIVRVDDLPVPVADSHGVPPIRDHAGHTGYGVAVGCHSLGLTTKFVDFVGADPQGELVLSEYARRGLDFSHLISPNGTRRAVNLVSRDGRRMSFYDGRDSPDLRMPPEFVLPLVERSRHVHVSIMNFARFLLDDIGRTGVPVSTDLHDWDGRQPYHREFALRADLVFLSAAAIAPGDLPDVLAGVLRDGRAHTVVATAGDDGCHVLTRSGDAVRHFPAVTPDRPVVDTNGAGDAFVSGYLYAHLAGAPVEACVRAGSVAGAHACGAEGTHADLITAPRLEAALSTLTG